MSTLSQVNALLGDFNEAKARVNMLQKEYNDLDALAREYDRQSVEHASKTPPDYVNSKIAADKRDQTVISRTAKKGDLDSAIARYKDVEAQYNNAVETLSPEEKTKAKAAQELALAQEQTSKASFMQGTTKYLIYGTIALVIVIGVIIVLRKKLAA